MSNRRLLAVHAHPDDESITMGGTLARYAATGVQVTLVTATLGEEGEVIGPELQGLTASRGDQLGGYRLTELRAACDGLGVRDHRMLGGLGSFRDSGMVGTPSAAHPRAFVRARLGGPDHDRAVRALVDVLDEVRPDVLLTYDNDGGYGHPDHIAAHEVAVAAAVMARVPRTMAVVRPRSVAQAAVATFAVPAGYLAPRVTDLGYLASDDQICCAVDVRGFTEARSAALTAHATQLELVGEGFALTNLIAQPLFPVEYYRLLAGEAMPANDSGPSGDVFDGLG